MIYTDDAIIAKVMLDDLIGITCGCEFAVVKGAEVPGESVMRSLLLVEWGNGEEAAIQAALSTLASGTGKLTSGEVAKILDIIDDTLLTEFVDPVAGKMPAVTERWYKKARKTITKAHAVELAWKSMDDKAVAWLADHQMYWVKGYFNHHLSDALTAHVAEGMRAGLGRSAIGQELKTFFTDYPGVGNQPLHYWRAFAANGMNRTRQFGLLQSWQDVGITELVIMAVMDERTSAICKRLDGEIIPLERGIAQRDLLMAAEDPEDVKTISPWVKVEEIEKKKIGAIMDQGVITPPYHGNCRTTLVER